MLQSDKFVELSNILAKQFPLDETIIYSQQQISQQIESVFEEYDWMQEAIFNTSGIEVNSFLINEKPFFEFFEDNNSHVDVDIQNRLGRFIEYWSKLSEKDINLIINNQLTYFYVINLLYHWMNMEENINTTITRRSIQHKIDQIN